MVTAIVLQMVINVADWPKAGLVVNQKELNLTVHQMDFIVATFNEKDHLDAPTIKVGQTTVIAFNASGLRFPTGRVISVSTALSLCLNLRSSSDWICQRISFFDFMVLLIDLALNVFKLRNL